MSQHDFLEDINLWRRLINDDRDALSRLYRKYYKPLMNYGMRLIPNRDLVKDSIQELFFTIWKSRENLSDVEYVNSYLYSSLRRSLFQQVKKQKSWDDRDRRYCQDNLHDSELNYEQRLILEEIKKEKKEDLQEAFENLNGHQKEVAFLKFYCGLSNDEISDIMKVKKESVYNYIYRAISSLKESMNISMTG